MCSSDRSSPGLEFSSRLRVELGSLLGARTEAGASTRVLELPYDFSLMTLGTTRLTDHFDRNTGSRIPREMSHAELEHGIVSAIFR